jgi:hypothetical protein
MISSESFFLLLLLSSSSSSFFFFLLLLLSSSSFFFFFFFFLFFSLSLSLSLSLSQYPLFSFCCTNRDKAITVNENRALDFLQLLKEVTKRLTDKADHYMHLVFKVVLAMLQSVINAKGSRAKFRSACLRRIVDILNDYGDIKEVAGKQIERKKERKKK